MNVQNRIKEFIKAKKITNTAFEKSINVSNGYVNSISKSIGSDVILKVIEKYPSLNIDWLLTGRGSMLREEDPPAAGEAIHRYGGSKVRGSLMEGGVPLYNLQAATGLQELFKDTHTHVPIGHISIPNMSRCDGALYVTGESMYPLIQKGDIVLYKKVEGTLSSFIWGEIYLVSFLQGHEDIVTVKYVYKGDDDKHIKLVGHNRDDIAHAGTDIPLTSIRGVAIVKAGIRRYML